MARKFLALMIAASGLALGGQGLVKAQPPDGAAARVTALADAYVRDYFDAFPEQALLNGAEDLHSGQLADHSLPALARWAAREDAMLTQLKGIDAATLTGRPQEFTYKFLQNQLESAVAFRSCRIELWDVSPTWTGWQATLAVVAGQQATGTADQQRSAVARFSQLPKYLDDEIDNLREGLRLGYTAPKHNVRTVVAQMDALLAAPVAESPFVAMAKADSTAFRKDLETLELTRIRPAIKKYRDFLETNYLPAAREKIGVSENPGGAACYQAAIAYHATVKMAPQQVHDLGLAQMAKIEDGLRAIGRRSFGTENPAALLTLARTDPKYRFKSREELIKYAEAAVERARLALPNAFGRLPKARVIVEPYPPYLEKSAPGGESISPTADGKPGKYLINAYKADEQNKAGLESTAFHETYPGHQMQGAIALERNGLHPIQRFFFLSGFGEGWALYSERLADELGLFTGDIDRLGQLSEEALRAARLVVDSGMHALGWTRAQAVDYMLAHTASTRDAAEAEIDRYIAVPAQATSYMIGNLEIRRLRDQATATLGAKFDLRAFHDVVLEDGTLPLWVLRQKVERWVASQGK
ncbi:MAG: DUF885 domain-containing protein [Acidobacteriota bacterium]